MLDANDLLETIKKAAKEAIEASQPSDFCFGKVTNVSPLNISIEPKMTLGVAQLVLTRNVTKFSTTVISDDETKEVTVDNALKSGDKVILLKQKGGQKYLVLDRVVNA